jgi:hypothetical protein
MSLKALAECVGTSVAMIDNSCGRFIYDRGLAPLMPAAAPGPETGNIRLASASLMDNRQRAALRIIFTQLRMVSPLQP